MADHPLRKTRGHETHSVVVLLMDPDGDVRFVSTMLVCVICIMEVV